MRILLLLLLVSCSAGDNIIYPPGAVIRGAEPLLDTTGRTVVPCSTGQNTAVIVVVGQSLSVNNVDSSYVPRHPGNVQMNVYDWKCYLTQDPMLGINKSGPGLGTWMSRFADMLIDEGHFERVVIVPIAVGATSVAMWADDSKPPYLPNLIRTTGLRMSAVGLRCTAVMWGQGESDTGANTSSAAYAASLRAVIANFGETFPLCPILVARESYYYGKFSEPVRTAQASVVDMFRVFPGEDVDSIGPNGRYDNTHLNAVGAELRARLAVDALVHALR
jgi:hypothetical protein